MVLHSKATAFLFKGGIAKNNNTNEKSQSPFCLLVHYVLAKMNRTTRTEPVFLARLSRSVKLSKCNWRTRNIEGQLSTYISCLMERLILLLRKHQLIYNCAKNKQKSIVNILPNSSFNKKEMQLVYALFFSINNLFFSFSFFFGQMPINSHIIFSSFKRWPDQLIHNCNFLSKHFLHYFCENYCTSTIQFNQNPYNSRRRLKELQDYFH